MSDEIKNSEKKSKSIMRNTKAVRYSKNLMFVAGAVGVTTGVLFSNTPKAEPNKKNKDENLKNTVDETQFMLKNMRNRNKMYIRGANLELIQLMEQGDQVVKSPWRSWQFGMNFFSNADIISGDGYGDKQEKYTYNSLYFRNNWKMKNALVSDDSIGVTGLPITPGNESQVSWRTANGNIYSGMNFDTSKGSSVNGEVRWGLVELRDIHEPLNEVEILARISPKEVKKEAVSLSVAEPTVEPVGAPDVNPNVNTPLTAPEITIPSVTAPTIPAAPSITITVTPPTIEALNISTPGNVGAITVTAPNVVPVDFTLSPAGLSEGNRKFQNRDYNMNNVPSINVDSNNYISTWGYVKGLGNITPNVNVNIQDTRAFMVDEGIDAGNTNYAPFKYTGTINLNKSKNVGIDVQGTHTSYSPGSLVNTDSKYADIKTVANVKVTNAGTIIGNGGAGIKNQVAFGFNNFDTSTNNTRTEMINEGNISLNAEESAGIQLRPEDPHAGGNTSDKRGLNMMVAKNEGNGVITLNGNGSFGMLTVQNKKIKGTSTTSQPVAPKTYLNYGITTLPGGQIASRAQKENMSYMKNTATINVGGTSSIGIGHLHNIQGVYAGGTINVTGSSSVGVYTEVPTRPVKVGYKDDHGLINTSSNTVGTETVEVTGTITVSGTGSSGVYAKDTGSITLKDNRTNADADADNRTLGNINVTGTKSYGAVLDGVQLDLEKNTQINVSGQEAIGYVLKNGTGSNNGTISVTGNTGNTDTTPSLGFYGEKGTFTNKKDGTISSSGNYANAVALVGNTTTGVTFDNKGKIETIGKGNIGVYADGKYTFNHSGNDAIINAGTNAVGIYAKNAHGTLNIKAPINIENSGTGTTPGTTIGIYSDGDAKVNFGENSKLTIGTGAVGLYSSVATKFGNTFKVEAGKSLEVELGQNSTFGLLNGSSGSGDVNVGTYLNNNPINISTFGDKASIFYTTGGVTANLNENYTVTNGGAVSTSVLVGTNGSTVKNTAKLTTNTNIGLIATKGAAASTAQNDGIIVSTRNSGIGIYTSESTGNSTGTITMQNLSSVGILGKDNSTLTNSGKIEISGASSAGIYGQDSNITNSGKKTDTDTKGIYVKQGSSAGIFGVVSGTADKTITNTGDIIAEAMPTGDTKSAGIYGELTSAGNKLTISHTGNITVNGNKSVGISVNNTGGTVANLVIDNTITTAGGIEKGTININNAGSIGIYAPKATVSGVGKVILKNDAVTNGSIAVYGSDGSEITSDNGYISLGKASQQRVAYYIKDTATKLKGAKIGEVLGYGVGVYLDGSNLNNSAPILNYTTGTDKGHGLIGLYLKNTTDISNYTKLIKVGDSVDAGTTNAKYAIGIYAEGQKKVGTTVPYEIQAPITTGANGIGIFVGKDNDTNTGSSIKYLGEMNIGNEATSGTGIYIADKPTAGDNEATLGSGSHINLNGTNGVGVIIGKGSKLSIESGATIEIKQNLNNNFKGVGVYGLKGSQIDASYGITNLIFKNNGNTAEIVRTVEGKANITGGTTSAKPGIVVTHVINGETSLSGGATISAVDDLPSYKAKNNIGLMAQGIKNPTAPAPFTSWDIIGNYEIVNNGTIDFHNSEGSTGIYAESARAQLGHSGKIMLGKKSTGIYGVYNSDSPKYEVAPPLTPTSNELAVKTLAGSEIELGEESVGVYLKNASTGINLDGKITSSAGATKNVGVYMINEAGGQADQGKKLEGMVNGPNAEITLGDGSVGLYSRGKGYDPVTDRNEVKNTGRITVGKKIAGAPSVGIYAENTKLLTDTTSAITVGEDGIAFYGKHSDITAKGTVNFNNKGVLAYLEDSNFVSYLGNISPTQNTMLYLKNSTAQMDGAGTKVDMTVADGYTGAYVEGRNSRLTGVRKITLGRNSNGIFLKDTEDRVFTSEIEEITGTQANAKGILGIDSNLLNKTKISLSGDNSIGIYSNADSTKSVVNEGKLELSGKKTLGVFLKGSQSFENKADISIADSADSQNPTIGVYTSETSPITLTSGNIEVGVKSIGVYSTTNSPVNMTGGNLHVKDEGMGIYKQDGSVSVVGNIVVDSHTATTPNTEPVGVYAVNGATVNDSANVTVGEKSYGFILSHNNSSKVNVYTNTAGSNVTLGSDSTYLYSGGRAQITNNKNIATGNVDRVIGFYIKGDSTGQGEFVNNGLLDFSTGKGNIAVYAPGSKATNSASGKIYVGATDYTDPLTGQIYSDKSKIVYGIGMATDNGGHIANDGEIRIFGDKSIGMYGSGAGTVVENRGNILLDGSRATASNKIESMTGVYVDEGAKFVNKGIIRTADSYAGREGKVNENVSGLVGVAVMNGSTLVNEAGAKILIDADNSYGVVIRGKKNADGTVQRYATIKNYGEISVRGRGTYGINWKDITRAELEDLENQINSKIKSDAKGQEIRQTSGTDKEFEGVKISIKNGEPVFTKDGVPVSDDEIVEISKLIGNQSNIGLSDIGFYVDTLGRTKPIDIDGSIPPINSQLIIGTEYSEMTNSKYWVVKGDVIKPFLDQITGRNFKLTSLAGSLTWMATPVLNSYGEITGVAMAKVPYTSYVKTTDNAWNFTDGLEQRYGVNSLDSREKVLFNKLNSIGKNEKVLLTQAFDEMMGHQYANIQQRTYGTGRLIDKEITHLSKEWETKSKQSNKIKVFGMKDEYTTDTAGIIDYTSNAYGFAYLHENETVKLGNVSGWYAGGVHNKFKFKDIGGSRENQTMLKLGIFKTMTPASDHNGNLQWTISGEGYVSKNDMHRKYLVVDEIFNAKSEYTTYGVAVKNEVGYNIRTSERTSIRPYGSLKVEYGRFSNIKEKSGEVRLDVQGNDYYSVKPEIGVEFKYRQPFAVKSIFTASLGLGYESELGKVGNVNNKARVSYTSADWFNIRGDKDSRKGKFKADLNFGIENSRVGMTLNTGYDSDNNNLRGGLGFRLIY